MKPLIAGNWKMNGVSASLGEADKIAGLVAAMKSAPEVVVCPPATLIAQLVRRMQERPVGVGGQDCHPKSSGAHTGDISAEMLADAGALYVIVGHSERRQDHGETDDVVKDKAEAARRAGLIPIVCVGETEAERRAGRHEAVVRRQVAGSLPNGEGPLVVAYEPVWAIGTGLTPTLEDIADMHRLVRELAGPAVRILYGGSVKPQNAHEILGVENVDGALVGGASLKADDFFAIISSAKGAR